MRFIVSQTHIFTYIMKQIVTTGQCLQDLAERHLTDILPSIEKIVSLHKAGESFDQSPLKLLIDSDKKISGVGVHNSVIDGNTYQYPFSKEFEAVIRPLRYSLRELGITYVDLSSARYSIDMSGAHLEGCAKLLLGWRYRGKSLGMLLRKAKKRKLLEAEVAEDMIEFTDLAVNVAKHGYTGGNRGSTFQFSDALHSHFLARSFGAIILTEAGKLEAVVDAVEDAARRRHYFFGAPNSVIPHWHRR